MSCVFAAPVAAAEYPCPSDPGACYFDVGNDRCFDAGTDTLGIGSDLVRGVWPLPEGSTPPPGSIVCPPSIERVDVLRLPQTFIVDWETAPGGHILLYAAKLRTLADSGNIDIDAGGDLLLGGGLDATGKSTWVDVRAQGDVVLEGKLKAKRSIWIVGHGGMNVVAKTKFSAQGLSLDAFGGALTLGEKVKVSSKTGSVRINAPNGDLTMASPIVKAGGELRVLGQNIEITGKSKLAANGHRDDLQIHAPSGQIGIDSLKGSARGAVSIIGDEVVIGRPNADGRLAASRLNSRKDFNGTYALDGVTVSGASRFELEKVRMNGQYFNFDTSAATLAIRNSMVIAPKNLGSSSTIDVPPGGTCDLTRTFFVSTVLTHDCAVVVGP